MAHPVAVDEQQLELLCNTFADHMARGICADDQPTFKYFAGLVASTVRLPDERGDAPIIVIAGSPGCGKTLFTDVLTKVVGAPRAVELRSWDRFMDRGVPAHTVLACVKEGSLGRCLPDVLAAVDHTLREEGSRTRIISTTNNIPSAALLQDIEQEYQLPVCAIHASDMFIGNEAHFEALRACAHSDAAVARLRELFATTDALLEGWRADAYPGANVGE